MLQGLHKRRHRTRDPNESTKSEHVRLSCIEENTEKLPNWKIMSVSKTCSTLNFMSLTASLHQCFETSVPRSSMIPQNITVVTRGVVKIHSNFEILKFRKKFHISVERQENFFNYFYNASSYVYSRHLQNTFSWLQFSRYWIALPKIHFFFGQQAF